MQKQLRIGILLILLLLVVETARLMIATLDHVEIQVLAVDQPPVNEVTEEALGVTPGGQPGLAPTERHTPLPSGGISVQKVVHPTTRPTRLASTTTYRPSPEPTVSATPTATLQPYRTVIPDRKPERQATAVATELPTNTSPGGDPAQPTSSPPGDNPTSPTNQPPETPTSAPAGLPTPAPDEPPTPQLPTEVP